jgi:transposase-like protein
VILGINQDGHKDVLGLWMDPSESKSTWLNILESLKTRGVKDVGFIMMDGVSGLEEVVKIIFPKAIVQRCIVHLMRNSIKFIPPRCYKAFCASIRLYTRQMMKFLPEINSQNSKNHGATNIQARCGQSIGKSL